MRAPPDPGLSQNDDPGGAVRDVLAKHLVPEAIDGEVVVKYVRKAVRLGVWRGLAPETRALLLVCRRLRRPARSPTLRGILSRIILEIELAGLRGKALLLGALEFLKRGLGSLRDLLSNAEKVLCLGISRLNDPPILRI